MLLQKGNPRCRTSESSDSGNGCILTSAPIEDVLLDL